MKNIFLMVNAMVVSLLVLTNNATAQNELGINAEHMPEVTDSSTIRSCDPNAQYHLLAETFAKKPDDVGAVDYSAIRPAEFVFMILGSKPAYWYITRMRVVSK